MSRELRHARNHVLLVIQSAQERVAGFLLEIAGRVPGDENRLARLPAVGPVCARTRPRKR
jgi:CRP-like cAMP-binding protein